MKNIILMSSLVLILFTSLSCGRDQELVKKKSLKFNWVKTSELNYVLSADELPLGKLNILENWIFFNDIQKNNTHKMIAANEGMSPLSVSWPEFKRYRIILDSIDFQQFDNYGSLEFNMHFFINETSIEPALLKTIILVSQNSITGFYQFEIKSSLKLASSIVEEFFQKHKTLEYQDILPDGVVTFMPALNDKWKWLVYKDKENSYKLPLHHHNMYNELPLKTDSEIYFGIEGEKEIGNPSFQFDQKTANATYFILCTWAYDLHFYLDVSFAINEARQNRSIDVNYSITCKTDQELANDFNAAKLSPKVEMEGFKTPAYAFNHKNDFEPSDLYKVPNDNYFWFPFADIQYCSWDFTEGYKSQASIKISNKSQRISSWKFAALSPSHLADFFLKGQYKISSMVKAKNAKGFIKIGWADSNTESINYSSFNIDGDTDWISLYLNTQDTSGAYSGGIFLEFDGIGDVWFDNVYFENIEN